MAALEQVGLTKKLEALGFNGPQRTAAIGTLVARMAAPGSELATHDWLQSKTLHIGKATRAEPRQVVIYNALGSGDRHGRTEKTIA